MMEVPPVWRSMLFVPGHLETFIGKAHERGADAIVLDLEDSVPAAEKPLARSMLRDGALSVSQRGAAVLVRINANPALATLDLQAAAIAEVQAILVPKVDAADAVIRVDQALSELETSQGMRPGRILIVAQIEDVRALPHLDEIAGSSPRLLGMTLGSEDFAASAGMEPVPQTLFMPNQLVLFACRRAGIHPFGFPASIAQYRDIAALRQAAALARQMGFVGALCIHPAQVEILNQVFVPSVAELEQARGLIDAYEAGVRQGRGAVEYRGKMIDPPVVARAQALLRQSRGAPRGED